MKSEPETLNITLPASPFTWRAQRFFILASALLSLYVIWPTSVTLAVCALLVGTPLFWLIFGSNIIFRYTTGMPIVRFIVVATLVYLAAKLLALGAPLLAQVLGGYVIA
jgi:hypothetical protein